MPRPTLPTHFKDMRTYSVQLTKTTEEDLKEHMKSSCERYEMVVREEIDEQNRILRILTDTNPYSNSKWRKGRPERIYERGYDRRSVREEDLPQREWVVYLAREFGWCMREFKWEDEWAIDFAYTIERLNSMRTGNVEEIKTLDHVLYHRAEREWKQADAEWIMYDEKRKAHQSHRPKSYYIHLFTIDKDAEAFYKGTVPDDEDTCELCIAEKKHREEREEVQRAYERQQKEEERAYEEERQAERRVCRVNSQPHTLSEHTCELCTYTTTSEKLFDIHLTTKAHQQKERQEELYCTACSCQCRTKLEYDHHLGTTKHKKNAGLVPTEPMTYSCEACAYSTQFKHHYDNHTKSKKHIQNISVQE